MAARRRPAAAAGRPTAGRNESVSDTPWHSIPPGPGRLRVCLRLPKFALQHPPTGQGASDPSPRHPSQARRLGNLRMSIRVYNLTHRPTPGDRCRRPDCGLQSADDEAVEAASEPTMDFCQCGNDQPGFGSNL